MFYRRGLEDNLKAYFMINSGCDIVKTIRMGLLGGISREPEISGLFKRSKEKKPESNYHLLSPLGYEESNTAPDPPESVPILYLVDPPIPEHLGE